MSVSFSDKYESDILFSPTKINGTFGEINRTMSDVRRLVPSLITIIIIINKRGRGRAAFRSTYPHEMAFSQALLGETRLPTFHYFGDTLQIEPGSPSPRDQVFPCHGWPTTRHHPSFVLLSPILFYVFIISFYRNTSARTCSSNCL